MSEWWVIFDDLGNHYVVQGPVADPFAGPFASSEAAEVWVDAFLSGAYL